MSKYKNVKRFLLNEKSLIKADVHDILDTAAEGQFLTWVQTASEFVPTDRFQNGAKFGGTAAYTEINSAGDMEYVGSATYWDDMRISVNQVKVPAANAPSWTAFGPTQLLGFADQAVSGNEEEVYFVVQMSHKYKQGTSLSPHVHYMVTGSESAIIRWYMQYQYVDISSTGLAVQSSIATASFNAGEDFKHKRKEFDDYNPSASSVSGMLLCKLTRNSSNPGDTYSAAAYLLEVDVHYQVDMPGSREEFSK